MSALASVLPFHMSRCGRVGAGQPYTYDYQVDGVAVEGLVGLEYHVGPRLSVFGDYKLSFSSNDADVNGGGTLETDVWTNHFILGLSYRFGGLD
jgi:lipid A oxidase